VKLKELGERLLLRPQPEIDRLVELALINIRENENIEELTAFFDMGPYELPVVVLIEAQERLLHLGDWTKTRLETYAYQLDLYYIKHKTKQWLTDELKELGTINASGQEYEALGREVVRRLREENEEW
jgi:hypothetical protein